MRGSIGWMRGRLGWVAGLLILVGCGEDVQTPGGRGRDLTLETPDGPCVVERIVRDDSHRTIDAALNAAGRYRRVLIGPPTEGPGPVGFSAELTGAEGVLYRVTMSWDPERPDRLWFREETATDVMTVSARLEGGRRFETYDINGDVFEVDYPPLDPETRRHAVAHSRDGWQPADPEIADFIARYGEFEEFYSGHAGVSLNNNADGEMLVSLLSNERFLGAAIGGEDGWGPKRMADRKADRICAIAGACMTLKCTILGGLLNPLCVPCAGTSVACVFTELACWIFDCGWE